MGEQVVHNPNRPTVSLYKYTTDTGFYITSKSSAFKMEQIECSETSANINQTPGKHPKVSTLDTEHGESLKSRISKTHYTSVAQCTHYEASHYVIVFFLLFFHISQIQLISSSHLLKHF
jgi:hypothetical protein